MRFERFVILIFIVLPTFVYGVTWDSTYGFEENDLFPSIQQTKDGGFTIIGDQFTSIHETKLRFMKLDQFGNIAWQKTFSENSAFNPNFAQAKDGGFLLSGTIFSSNPTLLIKVNTSGDIEWSKTIGASINQIERTKHGGFIAMGAALSLFRLDRKGNILWQKRYDSGDAGFPDSGSVQQTKDGGFVVTGSNVFNLLQDLCVLRLDQKGEVIWSKTFASNGNTFQPIVRETKDGGFVAASNGDGFVFRLYKLV